MSNSPITVVGNLTDDPKISTVGETTKAYFSVASEYRFQKDGEWTSSVSFFPVVAWRDLASQAGQVLAKGMRVVVTGRLDQRSYEQEGVKKSVTEVIAEDIAVSVRGLQSVERRPPKEGGYSGGGQKAASSSKPKRSEPDESPW